MAAPAPKHVQQQASRMKSDAETAVTMLTTASTKKLGASAAGSIPLRFFAGAPAEASITLAPKTSCVAGRPTMLHIHLVDACGNLLRDGGQSAGLYSQLTFTGRTVEAGDEMERTRHGRPASPD